MPVSYQIDRANKVVFTTASGRFTADDVAKQINDLLADSAFNSTFAQLFDFSTVKSVTLTPTEIKRFAEFSIFSPASKRAFVAPTPLFHGLARIYVAQRELMGDHGISIFSTVADARAWLGLPAVS